MMPSYWFCPVRVGNFITTQGAPVADFVLLNTLTASNSATLDDTTSLTSSYYTYFITFRYMVPVSSGATFWIRVRSGGTFQTTGYSQGAVFNGTATASGSGTTGNAQINANSTGDTIPNTASNGGTCGFFYIYQPSNTANWKALVGESYILNGVANSVPIITPFGGQWAGGTGAVDGIRFLMSSGNISTGTVKIYGIN